MTIRVTLLLTCLLGFNLYSYAQEKVLRINNISRTYQLRIPSSYDSSKQVPLVIVLHGYNNDVKGIGDYTGFNALAEKNGFICVCPFGTINDNGYYIWNAGGIYNDWTHNIDDVAFIDSLIDLLSVNYSIDPTRIYVTGHSNGSMMAYNLALHLSSKIAAVACVSGQMVESGVIPECPVAIMHIHGDADMVVPHAGTTQYGFQIPAVDKVIEQWLNWNKCAAVPEVLTYNSKVTAFRWTGNAEVRLYLLHGQGHDWPTKHCCGWEATEYIWDFFKENARTVNTNQ